MNMDAAVQAWVQEIVCHGFAVTPSLYSADELTQMTAALEAQLKIEGNATFIRTRLGHVYAARNVLQLWPEALRVWRRPLVVEVLRRMLGPGYGLVRGLFFDKPPEQAWWLPWHKDLTIAVRDNSRPSTYFTKPTRKADVPHVEAPEELLKRMLTVRLHIDAVTPDNGPMGVIPGSHTNGKALVIAEEHRLELLVEGGGIIFIRPLVAHNSLATRPGCTLHRRTLHFEFAADRDLPDGYAWHDFIQ